MVVLDFLREDYYWCFMFSLNENCTMQVGVFILLLVIEEDFYNNKCYVIH